MVGWAWRVPAIVVLLAFASAHCPNRCSGHGTCSFDQAALCTCFPTWTGADCSLRTCPLGKAWTGNALVTDRLHDQLVECSNMVRCCAVSLSNCCQMQLFVQGSCNRLNGVCSCLSGFGGYACQKSAHSLTSFARSLVSLAVTVAVLCPSDCNGHGVCMSLADAGPAFNNRNLVYDTTYDNVWDHDMIFGCVCDAPYYGYDCSLRYVQLAVRILLSSVVLAAFVTVFTELF